MDICYAARIVCKLSNNVFKTWSCLGMQALWNDNVYTSPAKVHFMCIKHNTHLMIIMRFVFLYVHRHKRWWCQWCSCRWFKNAFQIKNHLNSCELIIDWAQNVIIYQINSAAPSLVALFDLFDRTMTPLGGNEILFILI